MRDQTNSAPEWMDHGACRGQDTTIWFPASAQPHVSAAAIAVCNTCPVRNLCLEYAMEHGEAHGVWGGVTERGRQRLRRQQRLNLGLAFNASLTPRAISHGTDGGYNTHRRRGEAACTACCEAHAAATAEYKARQDMAS